MATIPSPDPLTEPHPVAADPEFVDHLRTYNGFLSLVKWFIIHLAVLILALYSIIIAHNIGVGFFFIFISLCLLVYGVTRRPAIRSDLAGAAAGTGGSAAAH